MTHPTNLSGSAPSLHPQPTPAQAWGTVPAVRPLLPAPAALPCLTVRPNGDVTITKALLAALPHLKDRPPIDVVPPVRRGRGGTWHLDTRATAPRRLPDPRKVARFSIPPPDRRQFQRVAPIAGPRRGAGQGVLGTVGNLQRLVFQLGPEVAGHPGYYELVPVVETV